MVRANTRGLINILREGGWTETFIRDITLRNLSSILGSVSFWPLLIIKLMARAVPERWIIRLIERQMRDRWNFLYHPLLASGGDWMKFIIM